MKIVYCCLCLLLLCGCKGKKIRPPKPEAPVYAVDLDRLGRVSVKEMFSAIELIPLQTTSKCRIKDVQMGVYRDNYYVWDEEQKKFFCFGSSGKFKYVLNKKNMTSLNRSSLGHQSHRLSILTDLGYRYQKKWYLYKTFGTEVYHLDEKGGKTTAYRWDFGKYNNKDTVVKFEVMPLDMLVEVQKKWMNSHAAFALSESKQNDRYIYVQVERIYKRTSPADFSQFVHLFYDKTRGGYKLFGRFTEGMELKPDFRINDTCMVAAVSFDERKYFICEDLLDAESKKVYCRMKKGDNPLIVKYIFKKE